MKPPTPPQTPSPATLGGPPPADFGALAWCYDLLASLVFGRALRRAQQAALQAGLPAGCPRVLVLGGGPGWVLTELLRRRPQARVLYLDASGAMLRRAQARLRRQLPAAQPQVEFRLGTERDLRPGEQFDALATFFVLDCFPEGELGPALGRLHAAATSEAAWLVADFAPPRRGWQRALLGLMYGFFRLTVGLRARRLPPWPAALAALGWRPQTQRRFFGEAVASAVYGRVAVGPGAG